MYYDALLQRQWPIDLPNWKR